MRGKAALIILLACLVLLPGLSACGKRYSKYQTEFMGVFDTDTVVIGYTETQGEFARYTEIMREELLRLHRLYDIYNDYDGINNLKTVNDNAGIAPVKVDADIIELLELAKRAYADTGGAVNVAFGPVLKIWHDYRGEGIEDAANAKLPPMEALRDAALNTDIGDLVIDGKNGTVFLQKAGMRLDVGAVAKGYAAEKAALAAKEKGMVSALLNVGGNIIAVGKPLDGKRDRWGVGIQDPQKDYDGVSNIVDTVFLNDAAAVTSGSYQRYYMVDGKLYNHIIDPATLMPAGRYGSVTVIHESSALADILSTAVFILSEEQGEKLLDEYGASALWIYFDGSMKITDSYADVSKEFGNYCSSASNR